MNLITAANELAPYILMAASLGVLCSAIYAVVALRAKHRAVEMLRDLMSERVRILSASAAEPNLSAADAERMIIEIEGLLRALPERDLKFVRMGLRQKNVAGAKRFMREVLNGTSPHVA